MGLYRKKKTDAIVVVVPVVVVVVMVIIISSWSDDRKKNESSWSRQYFHYVENHLLSVSFFFSIVCPAMAISTFQHGKLLCRYVLMAILWKEFMTENYPFTNKKLLVLFLLIYIYFFVHHFLPYRTETNIKVHFKNK